MGLSEGTPKLHYIKNHVGAPEIQWLVTQGGTKRTPPIKEAQNQAF